MQSIATNKIADQIKTLLHGCDERKMHSLMFGNYRTLQLISDSGKWASPELQKISGYLLPENITENVTADFVDRIATAFFENPYLVDFINKAQGRTFSNLSKKVATEGSVVIARAAALGMVFERLVCAIHDDPAIIKSCVEIHKRVRKETNIFKDMPVFYVVKFYSVEAAIKKYLNCFKSGTIKPQAGRRLLSLNIFEATVADYLKGHKDNAKASIPLIVNRPGSKTKDPRTGAGPTTISENKKSVRIAVPLPLQWANLYQTWNMAFVSRRAEFPFFLVKLLIPKVANYQNDPEEYMYLRVLALYLTLFHHSFDKLEKRKNNEQEIDWHDQELTELWGAVNLESSLKYKKELESRRMA